jgi:hypothetical protein
MNTDHLIELLSGEAAPIARGSLARRIVLGLLGGGFVTLLAVAGWLGFRPDLLAALGRFSFWMKWGYTISLGVGAVVALVQLARPQPARIRGLWMLAVPVLLLAGIGVNELAVTPARDWLAMWLGESWKTCPWRVLALAAPIFVGLLWSFRRLAPVRLRAAGAAAGLAAGAWAATLYCLRCPEASAVFVLTWYSLGMLLAAAVGAFLGPRLLRW